MESANVKTPSSFERDVADAVGENRRVTADRTWLYLIDPAAPPREHGWKLHVSARPETLAATADRVIPVLLRYTCDAKFARGEAVLAELNTGRARAGAALGKAVTIYPRPTDLVAMANELADALRGMDGPRIISDRRVRPDAPVYYRYGPFRAASVLSATGQLDIPMIGPSGETFSGVARTGFRCPPWASDPFGRGADTPRTVHLSGGRYKLVQGIAHTAHGNVYRAVETETHATVVIKQARAFVEEDAQGNDARVRLRHEGRILAILDGVSGVPRLIDYFRQGADEYLVMSHGGERDLRREVQDAGPYRLDVGGSRSPRRDWWALARGLLDALDAVHARGVVLRDLTPGNVVIAESGSGLLIDFGISYHQALDEDCFDGHTPGYGLPSRYAGERPQPADDYYGLGTTLYFAAAAMDPVCLNDDHAAAREHSLASLATSHDGAECAAALRVVAGLMSFDAAERIAAAESLRATGSPNSARSPHTPRVPTIPAITTDLLERIVEHTRDYCVAEAHQWPKNEDTAREPVRLNLYQGAAGIGWELAQHDDPAAREAVEVLARYVTTSPAYHRLPPALYTGRAGIAVFLLAAARATGRTEFADFAYAAPDADWLDTHPLAEQIGGASGTGTALLSLAGAARREGRAEDERRCVDLATACAHRLAAGEYDRDAMWKAPDVTINAAFRQGFSHGWSGVTYFQLAHHQTTGDPTSRAAALAGCEELIRELPALLASAGEPGATDRYAAWCRGLTGIGAVLVRAAPVFGDDCLHAAEQAARAAMALVPRMSRATHCCGLAGLGDFVIDLALATGSDEYWQAAHRLVGFAAARGTGTWEKPNFAGADDLTMSPAWASGSAGILTFLRRLRDRGGPLLGMPS